MTGVSVAGPRILLRQLREVMAGSGLPQQRLDTVTQIIAANMVAEVCSIYLLRPGDLLELYATHGLKPEAVHRTRLRLGEGIVGDIAAHARPLSLSAAQSHPQFAYRPETGEEIYHSMLGVPILRSGRVIGVLAVQNRTQREYTEDEAEALQTIAMVLAELVTSAELLRVEDLVELGGNATLPQRWEGLPLSEGLARGVIVLHEPPVEVKTHVAENLDAERERLDAALTQLSTKIDSMLATAAAWPAGEHRAVLEAYKMFSEDRGWLRRIHDAIAAGLTAEAAVERVLIETRQRLGAASHATLRERIHDFEDLSNRLLRHLDGSSEDARELPENAILVARSLGPAELLDYDRTRLRGLLLEEGAPTSHVALIARALEIPAVGRLGAILQRFMSGDPVIVDGGEGTVYQRPGEEAYQAYDESVAARNQLRQAFAALRDEPAVTLDGQSVNLHMNAGLVLDLPRLHDTGAVGIGLFRTEIQFMVQANFPDTPVQRDLYARILDGAAGKPVVFRTLDIGGDKVLPYLNQPAERETNPAMGWRALRVGLDRPAILRNQLRAMLMAAAGRELRVMFPMVADIGEYEQARASLDRERDSLVQRGASVPERILCGVMLEVPALIWQLQSLLPNVDFVSVGSNDLAQFLYAADRDNPRLAGRYDVLSPGFLSLLRSIARHCADQAVPVSVCGDMAGKPLEALALIGIGFRDLSVPASSVGPIKLLVRGMNGRQVTDYVSTLLTHPDRSVRDHLRHFAQDHGISI
ncbi:MAG: phosphoenolpyruvate--protein phosphotransferase [Alphaproteobacteria bacterium]|nr:phosphoenolpyruvate--protein phosphotransferase [Alphaproteobacteria bacterium]